MDAKDLEGLAAVIRDIVREEVERAMQTHRGNAYRLSQQALEQRRAAGKASAERRNKRRKSNEIRSTNPYRKSRAKSKTSNESVSTKSNENSEQLSTGLSTGQEPPETPVQILWRAYATSYKLRYGEFPPRNAKLNGMLKLLSERIPMDDAPGVVEHFFKLEEPVLVKGLHPVSLLLRDAEKYHTLWRTKAKVVNGNGHAAVPQARPWWETWSGIEEMGRRLGVAQRPDAAPQFRAEVYQMAAMCGEIPREICAKLGISAD